MCGASPKNSDQPQPLTTPLQVGHFAIWQHLLSDLQSASKSKPTDSRRHVVLRKGNCCNKPAMPGHEILSKQRKFIGIRQRKKAGSGIGKIEYQFRQCSCHGNWQVYSLPHGGFFNRSKQSMPSRADTELPSKCRGKIRQFPGQRTPEKERPNT